MKTKLTIIFLVIAAISLSAQTPVMDGVFDGEGVWGSPSAVADGVAGWPADHPEINAVNIDRTYVTYDANFVYFCALFVADGEPTEWMRAAFAINSKTGGGTEDPWGAAVAYGYADPPDVLIVGRLGENETDWAELRIWNGANWDDGMGVNVFDINMFWTATRDCIEAKLPLSSLEGVMVESIDYQFYVSGNNATEHGTFDACPDDDNAIDWDSPTVLDNYRTNQTVPVELAAFNANVFENNVELSWKTTTEKNNQGFEIERSIESEKQTWSKLAFIEGKGNSTEISDYSFVDKNLAPGKYTYRLKQIDYDGTFEYSNSVEVEVGNVISKFSLSQNYPNPFNPSTVIEFTGGADEFVKLKVYNTIGEAVAVLFEGGVTKGSVQQINFDASNLPAGIYYYQLISNSFVSTKKMILLK